MEDGVEVGDAARLDVLHGGVRLLPEVVQQPQAGVQPGRRARVAHGAPAEDRGLVQPLERRARVRRRLAERQRARPARRERLVDEAPRIRPVPAAIDRPHGGESIFTARLAPARPGSHNLGHARHRLV
jgi:hypothetical protein